MPSVVDASVTILITPSVYLVGKQLLQQSELDRFLADHGVSWQSDSEVAAEVINEVSGRICYMSFAKPRPGGNSAYLHHIKEVGHGSVLEHAVWNFVITGVSRTLTHELVRHRAGWAYSQLSQRYVDESVAEYVEPDIIAGDPELHALWLDAVTHAHAAYVKLSEKLTIKLEPELARRYRLDPDRNKHDLDQRESDLELIAADRTNRRKAARQAARSVLPNATETKISVTANARALRHFLEQRGSRHAEPEIRKLANAMLVILAGESPNLFGDYKLTHLPDGTSEITTKFPKV